MESKLICDLILCLYVLILCLFELHNPMRYKKVFIKHVRTPFNHVNIFKSLGGSFGLM